MSDNTKQELEELYGTPEDFARNVMNAHGDGFVTLRAAKAAIREYELEYAEAGPVVWARPAIPANLCALPVPMVDAAAKALLKHQGVDVDRDLSAYYPALEEAKAVLRSAEVGALLYWMKHFLRVRRLYLLNNQGYGWAETVIGNDCGEVAVLLTRQGAGIDNTENEKAD